MKNSISTKPTKPNNIKSIFSVTEENDLIEWYKERPKAIQDIAKEVPFGTYIINDNASGKYKFSTPGCTVKVLGYVEGEEEKNIIIATLALTDEAKQNVKDMNTEHGKDFDPETSNFKICVEKEDLTLLDESKELTLRVLELFNQIN